MVSMNDGQPRKPIGDELHDIQTLYVDLKSSRLLTAGDVSDDAQSSWSSSFIFQRIMMYYFRLNHSVRES